MIGRLYLKNLWLSLSTPQYYFWVLREPLRASILFLVISCVWLGTLNAVFFGQKTLPSWQKISDASWQELETNYPASLQLAWNQSTLQLHPPTPVTINYPSAIPIDTTVVPPALAVVSPTELAPSQFGTLPTASLAVVTPTKLYVTDQRSWNSTELTELPGFDQPFTITRQTLPEYIGHWRALSNNLLNSLKWLSFVAAPVVLLLSSLWSWVINAILAYWLLKLTSVYFKFSTVLKLSAHIVVACLVLQQLHQWLYPQLNFPVFSLCYWAYMAVIIFVIRRQAEINRLKQMIREQ